MSDFKAKMQEIIERDGDEVVLERLLGDPSWRGVQGALDEKTDEEVADLLTKFGGGYHHMHPVAVLCSNAAERLRRAKGGPTGG